MRTFWDFRCLLLWHRKFMRMRPRGRIVILLCGCSLGWIRWRRSWRWGGCTSSRVCKGGKIGKIGEKVRSDWLEKWKVWCDWLVFSVYSAVIGWFYGFYSAVVGCFSVLFHYSHSCHPDWWIIWILTLIGQAWRVRWQATLCWLCASSFHLLCQSSISRMTLRLRTGLARRSCLAGQFYIQSIRRARLERKRKRNRIRTLYTFNKGQWNKYKVIVILARVNKDMKTCGMCI